MKIKIDIINPRPGSIWDNLTRKLGRAPTNAECRAECIRILHQPFPAPKPTNPAKP